METNGVMPPPWMKDAHLRMRVQKKREDKCENMKSCTHDLWHCQIFPPKLKFKKMNVYFTSRLIGFHCHPNKMKEGMRQI